MEQVGQGKGFPPEHGSLTSGSKGVLIPDLGNGMSYRQKRGRDWSKGNYVIIRIHGDRSRQNEKFTYNFYPIY